MSTKTKKVRGIQSAKILAANGNKIAAIKYLRDKNTSEDFGLKEAKDIVESWWPTTPLASEQPRLNRAEVAVEYSDAWMEEIHAAGSKRHPELWMGANISALNAARFSSDPSQRGLKELISRVTLFILDGLNRDGRLVK